MNKEDSISKVSEIFAEYGDFINVVIRSKVKNETHVEDIYQSLFLSLASKSLPEDIRNINAYLYKVITYDVIDYFRRIRRDETLKDKFAENIKLSINPSSSTNDLYIEEKTSKIMRIIQEYLSPAEAEAIILRYKEDCSNEEITEKMGIKKETVSRYICVGLKKIQQILAEEKNRK